MGSLKFIIKNNDEIMNYTIDFENINDCKRFAFDKYKLDVIIKEDYFKLIRESDEDTFIYELKDNKVTSSIYLKNESISVFLPIIEHIYLYKNNGALIEYKIDGDENLHSMEFIY